MKFQKKLLLKLLDFINFSLAYFKLEIRRKHLDSNSIESIIDFMCDLRPMNQVKRLIRIGSENDGGYLIPDDLEGIEYCYSPGVSDNSEFENQITLYGIECYLADFSVELPPIENDKFYFTKKYLSNKNDVNNVTLEKWISDNKSSEDMLLQMDIEGAEYKVLLETPDTILRKFRIIIIEFHGFNELTNKVGFELISTSFYKLMKNFKIVHVHANNCCKAVSVGSMKIPTVMEFTFLRNDRFYPVDSKVNLPHELDSRNILDKNEIELPEVFKE